MLLSLARHSDGRHGQDHHHGRHHHDRRFPGRRRRPDAPLVAGAFPGHGPAFRDREDPRRPEEAGPVAATPDGRPGRSRGRRRRSGRGGLGLPALGVPPRPGQVGQLCLPRRHRRQRDPGAPDRAARALAGRGRVEPRPGGRHAQPHGPAGRFPGEGVSAAGEPAGAAGRVTACPPGLLSGRRRKVHGPRPAREATRPPGTSRSRRDYRPPGPRHGGPPAAAHRRAGVPDHRSGSPAGTRPRSRSTR